MKNMKIFNRINLGNVTVMAAVLIFLIFFLLGSVIYDGFLSTQILFNLFIDNAHLLIRGGWRIPSADFGWHRPVNRRRAGLWFHGDSQTAAGY